VLTGNQLTLISKRIVIFSSLYLWVLYVPEESYMLQTRIMNCRFKRLIDIHSVIGHFNIKKYFIRTFNPQNIFVSYKSWEITTSFIYRLNTLYLWVRVIYKLFHNKYMTNMTIQPYYRTGMISSGNTATQLH
jgi:hypothetical protein